MSHSQHHLVFPYSFFLPFFAWVCLPNLFGMILKAFPSPSTSQAPLTRSVPLGSGGYREALTPRDQECWWVAGTSRPIPQAKSPRPWMGNLKISEALITRNWSIFSSDQWKCFGTGTCPNCCLWQKWEGWNLTVMSIFFMIPQKVEL